MPSHSQRKIEGGTLEGATSIYRQGQCCQDGDSSVGGSRHLPAVLQSEAGALTHRIKHVSVGIQGPCTQRISFIDLLKTPTSESSMKQRNREERRALEGERKGAMRKDGGKTLAGFAPCLLSPCCSLPSQTWTSPII